MFLKKCLRKSCNVFIKYSKTSSKEQYSIVARDKNAKHSKTLRKNRPEKSCFVNN